MADVHAEAESRFPTVRWGDDTVDFQPGDPDGGPAPFAVLVFPFYGDRVVLADIAGRGWCVPSGRIEPGETEESAVRREALEEAGIVLGDLHLLGTYRFRRIGAPDRVSRAYVAAVEGVEPFTPGAESLGRHWFAVEDVAEHYCMRDALLDAVFDLAWRMRELLLPRGTPIDDWISDA
ncbi:MAG: NUDIX domain-containing protein [Armatimonadota bacterium]